MSTFDRGGRGDRRDAGSLRFPGGLRFAVVLIAATAATAAAQSRPTFTKDIAPIVWTRCATCHRPGEIGPFSLLTYDDVRQRATLVAAVTARRIMPPWKPEPGKGEFQDERALTPHELESIQRWVANGAPEGDPADLPPMPRWPDGWRLGAPDLVVRMRDVYTVPADGADVFRTFVLSIPTTHPQYVRAIEFRPGNARVVHHANIGVDRTRSSRLLDERDPGPGYDGGMVPSATYPEGQLLGWTPGQAPHAEPPEMSWRLDPGSDLVVQLHLQPIGKPAPLEVSAGFYFTEHPPTRTPVGLRLGSGTIDIPPGQRDYEITDSYTTLVEVEAVAVQPHAHNLARRMTAIATLPEGSTRWLISIADWDFRWQDVYRYARPVVLPKGTTISMRYSYDNSANNPRNPRQPPARVVWGQNTADEMGDLWIQLVPRNAADFAALNEDVQRKRRDQDLATYTTLLRAHPDDPLRHDAVAAIYLEARRLDEAIVHFGRSLELNPASAPTQYNLGYALALRGQRDEAMKRFREALRLDPDYAQAHNNLAAMLQLSGRFDEALDHYRRALTLRPDNVEARGNLAQLLSQRGRPAEAAAEFEQVLAAKADDPQALSGLAWIRATAADPALRNPAEAIQMAERAVTTTSRRDLAALDALAAGYAAAGRFDAAVETAQAAVDVAAATGRADIAARFRERLALYQRREAYRVPQ
jgi:tetratricopeptide (TPR) repeat protein/mono/diheme cytochrome c family protein